MHVQVYQCSRDFYICLSWLSRELQYFHRQTWKCNGIIDKLMFLQLRSIAIRHLTLLVWQKINYGCPVYAILDSVLLRQTSAHRVIYIQSRAEGTAAIGCKCYENFTDYSNDCLRGAYSSGHRASLRDFSPGFTSCAKIYGHQKVATLQK